VSKLLLLFVTCFSSIAFARAVGTEYASGQEDAGISFDSKEPLFISLGPDCYFAGFIDQIGYRKASFPFDWLLILDHSGMIKILDEDFKHFLDPSCYSIRTANRALVNHYYHIEFFHEHDNDFIGKYGRRIDRFRRLNNYMGKVFFLRKSYEGANEPNFYWPSKDLLNISFEHALELKQVLKKRFPNLDFSLVIMNLCDDRSTIKIIDDIIMINAHIRNPLDFLPKLINVLSKYALEQILDDALVMELAM
jgi:hypothetical protein